jgi:hypothetical protein
MVELYLRSTIGFNGIMFNYIIEHRNKFTIFTLLTLEELVA